MPLTFWCDGGDARYRATYFGDRPEIWTHGDIAELVPTGGGFVHGRSDSTLKPGGVRIGISEIYAACEAFPEIDDFVFFWRRPRWRRKSRALPQTLREHKDR